MNSQETYAALDVEKCSIIEDSSSIKVISTFKTDIEGDSTLIANNEDRRVSVFLRIKPGYVAHPSLKILDSETVETCMPTKSRPEMARKRFKFEAVFTADSSQREVYSAVKPLIGSLFGGEKNSAAVIFAYGSTNSGKTHTMIGPNSDPGILPLAMSDIFEHYTSELHNITMSCTEVYMDKVFDLLCPAEPQLSLAYVQHSCVHLRKDSDIKNATKTDIHSSEQASQVLREAQERRQTFSNNINQVSSRGHLLCTVQVKNIHSNDTVILCLVDLAGSERRKSTCEDVIRNKEADQINSSLSTLWLCLRYQSQPQSSKSRNIESVGPYRNSKLTWILKDVLEASEGRVAVITTASSCSLQCGSTLHVLENASSLNGKELIEEPSGLKNRKRAMHLHTHDSNGRRMKRVKTGSSQVGYLDSSFMSSSLVGSEFKSQCSTNFKNKKLCREIKGLELSLSNIKNEYNGKSSGASSEFDVLNGARKDVNIDNTERNESKAQITKLSQENRVLHVRIKELEKELLNTETRVREEITNEMEIELAKNHLYQPKQRYGSIGFENYSEVCDNAIKSVRKAREQRDMLSSRIQDKSEQVIEGEQEMDRMQAAHDVEVQMLKEELLEAKRQLEAMKAKYEDAATSQTSSKLESSSSIPVEIMKISGDSHAEFDSHSEKFSVHQDSSSSSLEISLKDIKSSSDRESNSKSAQQNMSKVNPSPTRSPVKLNVDENSSNTPPVKLNMINELKSSKVIPSNTPRRAMVEIKANSTKKFESEEEIEPRVKRTGKRRALASENLFLLSNTPYSASKKIKKERVDENRLPVAVKSRVRRRLAGTKSTLLK